MFQNEFVNTENFEMQWAHQVRMIKRGCSRMAVASLFVRETYIQRFGRNEKERQNYLRIS